MVRLLAIVGIGATCDATTAVRPPEVRAAELTWGGDTVLVVGTKSPVDVAVRIDGEPYPMPRLRVASSDTSIVQVGDGGASLVARRLGRATITVQMLSTSIVGAPAMEREVIVSPMGMVLTIPADTLTSLGETMQLGAAAVDAGNAPIAGAPASWTSSDTTVLRIDGQGLVTARANGEATVTATIGVLEQRATLVVHQKVAALRLSLTRATLDALGADTTLSAESVDGRGNPIVAALATPPEWESAAPGVATVAAGRIVAVGNGVAYIHARAGTVCDSARIDVVQRATRIVVETPGPLEFRAVGEKREANARGYDRRDNEVTKALPTWRSLDPLVAHVDAESGEVTAVGVGQDTLLAEQDGVSAPLVVRVTNPPAQVVLEPATATITSVGDTLALRWSVRNARGVEIPGAPVALASSDTLILRALATGHAVAVAPGAARIVATAEGGAADTTLLTVVDAVANVNIVPAEVTMASVGDTVVPEAVVRNARGSDLPRGAATWTSDDAGTARVTAGGLVIATGAGETVVRATSPTWPDRRDSLVVVVTNAPASVVIERETDVLNAVGASRAYAAEVRNARQALLAVMPTWRSLDASIARVSTTGLVTATGPGTVRLIATAGAASDTLVLTVQDDVASVEVTPATATLTSLGDVLRPTLTARNALGSVVPGATATWESSDTLVARVQPDASVLAVGTGRARVTATIGTVADTLLLTVTNEPATIEIAAAMDTIPAIGDSVRLAVTVRNARGDTLPRSTIAWSTEDPVVARVNAEGVVTARSTGTTWVRATGGTAADSILIVVTNDPARVILVDVASGAEVLVDTLTAAGQTLTFGAQVLNALGRPIGDAVVGWRSTVTAVATVSPGGASTVSIGGVATAMGMGTTLIIARAGEVEDTLRLTVIDPRRLYVDNAVVVPVRVGTLARPYATIQDAVNAAGVDDTVVVQRGNGYSEAVTLGRRVTLLGDSAAYVQGGRDPLLLPRLSHDLGAAGITATTPGASYTIRYLAVQHSVDGEAIAVRDAEHVIIDQVHVNPVASFRTGRGILVERAQGSVLVARGRVDSVNAFGVRVVESANARVEAVTVRGVGARGGLPGAGIDIVGGTAPVVTGAVVRRTAGAQVQLTGTTDASLLASTLVGEQQLARLVGVLGATTVRGNTFDARRQAGEPAPVRGGGTPDPSALEVTLSAGVLVDGNTFTDVGGQASLMDGVRLAGVRPGTGGATFGAVLTANRFGGGRSAIRSEGATWTLTGARIDSAATGVLLTAADTVTLERDTIRTARVTAVQSTGAGASLRIVDGVITGPQRAVTVANAADVVLRRTAITGTTGLAAAEPTLGAVDVAATSSEIVGNAVTSVRGFAGILLRGGAARVDSNLVTRNLIGVRATALAAPTLLHNAFLDNDTLPAGSRRAARALVNDGAPLVLAENWWGDPRGPQRGEPLAPATYGDSVVGAGVWGIAASPIAAHAGMGTPGAVRKIAGDAQSAPPGTVFPLPLVVRVVDAQGRPLAGASVTFRVTNGDATIVGGSRVSGRSQLIVTSDASGFAQVELTSDVAGTNTISATAGSSTVTFTATAP